MRSVTAAYRRIIASGESRNFLITVNMTLADNTRLTLTEEDIWADSFGIDTASSGKNTFDIGSAVIGMCKFQINNFDEKFNRYDFFSATAVVWVKLIGDDTYYRLGFYTVDDPKYVGPLISLELLNNMWKFDVPLSEAGVVFPTTMGQAVARVCAYCGVSLATQTFHGYNFVLDKAPDQNMNCRELLQYIAMIGCNFCDIDDAGSLRLKWYDTASRPSDNLDGGTFYTNTTPYSDGDVADGGNFINYQHGANYDGGSFTDNPNVAYFTRNFNTEIGTDEITVTGVKITINDTEYMIGERGYVLDLKENPLVNEDNVNTVLNLIWDVLKDFRMRTFNATTLPDLSVEIGDCCVVKDLHGNYIVSYVTNNSFRFADYQVSLGAISPARTLVKRYSKSVQAAVEVARQKVNEQLSTYDLAVQTMNSLAINAMGAYYDYEDLATGGRVYYLSNMPIEKDEDGHCSFTTNSSVFKTTGDGLFVSVDGGRTWTNGYNTHTGELIVNVLYTIGLHADWINAGTLTVGGNGTKPTIRVLDSSNNVVCTINSDGIIMGKGYIASSDYAEKNPVGTFSRRGMKIDVTNKFIKSPHFAFNDDGAYIDGEVNAESGHIGAAVIDTTSLKVVGDLTMYNGTLDGYETEEFTFVPYDYRLATDFQFKFSKETYDEDVSCQIILHQNDTDTLVWNGIIYLSWTTIFSGTLSHLIGQNEDEYYTVRIYVRGEGQATVNCSVYNAILGYIGEGGIRGIFSGVLDGYLDNCVGMYKGELDCPKGKVGNLFITGNKEIHAEDKIDITITDSEDESEYGNIWANSPGEGFAVYIRNNETVSEGTRVGFDFSTRHGYSGIDPQSGQSVDYYRPIISRHYKDLRGHNIWDEAMWESAFVIGADISPGTPLDVDIKFYIVTE